MEKDAFQTLKETCNRACHERHACAKGYKQMLASGNVSQMMATWRDNWLKANFPTSSVLNCPNNILP